MTQPNTTPQPHSQPPAESLDPMPVFTYLHDYINAAATGGRSSLYHLFMAVFAITRAAVAVLSGHYQAHPRALTPSILARLKYCAERLKAIYYTLQHAPGRFLTPAQLRALTRARAVLSHILKIPIDFTPLAPLLATPAACPPPPRAKESSASSTQNHSAPSAAPASSPAADPLLLRSPGCALASVLLQLAAIYRVPASPALAPPPLAPPPGAAVSTPSAPPPAREPALISDSVSNPPAPPDSPHDPQAPFRSPP